MKRMMIALASAALLAGCTTYDDARYGDNTWRMTHNGNEIDYEGMDQVLFANDSAELSHHAYDAIVGIADEVRRHQRWLIDVDGYTDTVGTHEHNETLSRARAQSVADALAHNGVEPGRISVRGLGETRLAVETGNNVAEPRNRRVVIRLLPPDGR